MYSVIYKDVVLFHSFSKESAIIAIKEYVEKRGMTLQTETRLYGRINLFFFDKNKNCYTYTIIKDQEVIL